MSTKRKHSSASEPRLSAATRLVDVICDSLVFDGHVRQAMVAVCAEPGMGRGEVVDDVFNFAGSFGVRVVRRSFLRMEADAAARQLTRIARETCAKTEPSLVILEELPPADEIVCRRMARALVRLWSAGVPTLVTLVPEAYQVLEVLDQCKIFTSPDLLVSWVVDAKRSESAYGVKVLTGGIPSLVGAVDSADGNKTPGTASPYVSALTNLVGASLRTTLPREDLRVRLAMLLLGFGSVEDLKEVLPTPPEEALEDLRAFAPLFGVSEHLDSFRCLRAQSLEMLDSNFSALAAASQTFPEVASACARVLAHRGDYERAALVIEVSGVGHSADLLLARGAEFIDVSRGSLVNAALQSLFGGPLDDGVSGAGLSYALQAVGTRRPNLSVSASRARVLAMERPLDSVLFLEARRVLRAQAPLGEYDEMFLGPVGMRLLAHRKACDLMAEGRFTAAMRLLVSGTGPWPRGSLSGSLLTVDAEFARMMLGDPAPSDKGALDAAKAVLSRRGVVGLGAYVDCLDTVEAVFVGMRRANTLATDLATQTEVSGDVLAQVVALVSGCVADLRGGAGARATVRAQLAASLAHDAGLGYLERVATLFGRVTRFVLGEDVSFEPTEVVCDDLSAVEQLIGEVMLLSRDTGEPISEDLSQKAPRDALWVLLLLTRGLGVFSKMLIDHLPREWWRTLELASGAHGGAISPSADDSEETIERSARIEVFLLGGFEMFIDGTLVSEGELDKRRAKTMLVFLLLKHGRSAKRFEIVEAVWPSEDYVKGLRKVYQSTSHLRSVVATFDPSLDAFQSTRTGKTVSISKTLVYCDVDEFCTCAHETVDATDDARVLEMAKRAERIYQGDLYMPAIDGTGEVSARRLELRRLFADAMISGSDAALRLGHNRTAVRMATNATQTDETREDAMIALVRALKSSGRIAEAETCYRHFANRLMETLHRAPSKKLRQALGADGEGTTARFLDDSIST